MFWGQSSLTNTKLQALSRGQAVQPLKQNAYRAAKYIDDFSADHGDTMCNIQNRTIPVVQLIQFQKRLITNFKATGVAFSNATYFSTKLQPRE
jgi:hypothetical protein